MKKLLLLSIIIASITLLAIEPQFIPFNTKTESFEQSNPQRSVEQRGNDLHIQWQFSGMQVINRLNANIPFEQLSVAGFGFTQQVGAPALPAHTDILALRNADAHLEITSTETIILDGYRIHPALEPARDTQGAPEPSFVQDAALYQQDAWYPANPVRISQIQYYREVPMAFVEITPIQYNPATGQIRIHTQLSYRLSSRGGSDAIAQASSQNSNHALANLRNYVLNPDEIGQSTAYSREDAKEYIIITHSNYLDAANDLAAWKQQLGYSVEVVSQSSWTSVQVKDAIHTRYASYSPHPDYFVIIGDHTGSYAVPGEIHQDPSYGDDFATDLYYACMNGTGDVTPDMAHGRISASTAAEAQVIVDKIINYEKNPVNDASYYSNGVNCAQYQDDDNNGYADRRFCHTSEDIRDYLIDQGYSVDRIYYTSSSASVNSLHYNNGYYSTGGLLPSELRSATFDWAGGASDITSAINAGKFYVFHRDHGYVGGSGWAHPYYTTTSMTSLSNGAKLPVVFSINCHTGEFQLDNCFAEKLIRMEGKGAVGVVAAAYYSYSGYNDGFATGMVDAIWHEPGLTPVFGSGGVSNPPGSAPTSDIITMGDVINQGLIRMAQTWGSNTYTNELFHYFGDPAMKIWTANPYNAEISATITPSPLYVGDTNISIAGCTVSDPLVTVIAGGEIIAEQSLSGTSGTVSFAALDASVSQVVVTLSAPNAKPMESILAVAASSSTATGDNGDGSGSATVTLSPVNTGSTVVNPEVIVDPPGTTPITLDVTVSNSAVNPITHPENVALSYQITIGGNVTNQALDFILDYTGLDFSPTEILWYSNSTWSVIPGVEFNTPTTDHAHFTVTIPSIRDASTEFVLQDGDSALPVTLSTCYAVYDNQPIIYWMTQSETGNLGWNIYRSCDDADDEILITNELIPGAGTSSQQTAYHWVDSYLTQLGASYSYSLESVDFTGITYRHHTVTLTIPQPSEPGAPPIPQVFGLYQNYPNPFNPSTQIQCALPTSCLAQLTVYNTRGQVVRKLYDGILEGNTIHSFQWDGMDDHGKPTGSGIYLYTLRTTDAVFTQRMLQLK